LADSASFEISQRREWCIQRRLREARVPVLKALDSFDHGTRPTLDQYEILELSCCDSAAARREPILDLDNL